MKDNRTFVKYIIAFIVLMAMRVCLGSSVMHAQSVSEHSTYGTEFWTAFMSNSGAVVTDISIDLTIYVILKEPAESAVNVIIEANGVTLGTIAIPAGERFGTLNGLTVASAYLEKTSADAEITTNKGVRIYSEDENTVFACYTHSRQGNIGSGGLTQDASLIYPTRILGREYVVQTYEKDSKSTEFAIIATEDNTNVTIVPSCATFSNSWTANTPRTVSMNAGQTFYVPSYTMPENSTTEVIDLSGSTICASKPVAVIVGHENLKVPLNQAYSGDHAYEQLLSIANMGTQFYVALPSKSTNNAFKVTAAYDNTVVTLQNGLTTTITTLDAGQSTPLRGYAVTSAIPTAVITTSQPAVCYTYENCGATNNEFDPVSFVTTSWGNPGNAMNPSWVHRLKSMAFFTKEMEPELDEYGDEFEQKHFVQIITATADVGTITIDGVAVPSSAFTPFAADNTKSYANIELAAGTFGMHEVTTTGDGFIGEVYGVTNGQSYMYTLGFNPNPYIDSLFIKNTEEVMSPYSYPLQKKADGWYQRQPHDWLQKDSMRIDTAYICDSTLLHFDQKLAVVGGIDSIVWQVFEYDTTGTIEGAMIKHHAIPYGADSLNYIHQLFDHIFALDPQKDLMPWERTRWGYFKLQNLIYRQVELCDNLEEQVDTFQTMIHVARAYDDTISRRVICINDSIRFFYDDKTHTEARAPHSLDSTIFISKDHPRAGNPYYNYFDGVGDTVYTRTYSTIFGCDSIMRFHIHVCDTFHTVIDTFVCENHVQDIKFPDKFIGVKFDSLHSKTYYDTLKTKQCMPIAQEFEDWAFDGCDSIIEFRLNVSPVARVKYVDYWCAPDPESEDPDVLNYYWTIPNPDDVRKLDTIMTIHYTAFNRISADWKGNKVAFFSDTVCNATCTECHGGSKCVEHRGCDSIRTLELNYIKSYRISYDNPRSPNYYCDSLYDMNTHTMYRNESYVWLGHEYALDEDGNIAQPQRPRVVYNKNWGRRMPVDSLTYLPRGYYVIIDSMKSVSGCDSIITLPLTVYHTPLVIQSHSMPDNATYTWTGHNDPDTETEPWVLGPFKHDTIIYDNIVQKIAYGACDSIFELHIKIGETYLFYDTLAICDYDSISWNEHLYSQTNPSQWRHYWDDTNRKTVYATDLFGSKYADGGYPKGEYTLYDSLKTVATESHPIIGDSVWCLTFKVYESYEQSDELRICDNDTVTWQNRLFIGDQYSGDPIDESPYFKVYRLPADEYSYDTLFSTINDCDSIFYLRLNIYKTYNIVEDSVVCQDNDFVWALHEGHTLYNEHGEEVTISTAVVGDYTFIDHLYTGACSICNDGLGCDSIHTLHLRVNPSYIGDRMMLETDFVCSTDLPYQWHGKDLTLTGIYYDTIGTTNCGCDSVYQLTLTVVDNTPKTIDTTVCNNADPFVFGVQQLTFSPADSVSGLYEITKAVVIGDNCGYMETLRITVNPIYDQTEEDEVCQTKGAYFTWEDHTTRDHVWDVRREKAVEYDRIPMDEAGEFTFIDSLLTRSACACDSIITLTLTIHPSYDSTMTHQMDAESVYHWGGDDVWYYGPNAADKVPDGAASQVCIVGMNEVDSFYTSIHGCDSIMRLRLLVGGVFRDTLTQDVCDSTVYEWRRDGKTQTDSLIRTIDITTLEAESAWFYDSLRTSLNYDSIYVLHLIKHPTYYNHYFDTVCQNTSYTWKGHTIATDQAGWVSMNDTVPTYIYACDSISSMHLLVLDTYWYNQSITMSEEDSVRWQGQLYIGSKFEGDTVGTNAKVITQSVYHETVTYPTHTVGGHSCDSTYYLTLRIGQVFRDTVDGQTCDNTPYEWHRLTRDGQDSLVRVIGVDEMTETITLFYDSLRTDMDYDSIYVLRLTKNPTYAQVAHDTICQMSDYVWEKHEGHRLWDAAHEEYVTAINTANYGEFEWIDSLKTTSTGCDTVWTLYLKIEPTYNAAVNKIVETRTMCDNDSIHWEGHLFFGTHFKDFGGSFDPTEFSKIDSNIVAGDYADRDTAFYKTTIRSASISEGCDSLRFLHLIVMPTQYKDIVITTCDLDDHSSEPIYYPNLNNGVGGDLPLLSMDKDTTIHYWDTIPSSQGCDSVVHLTYTIYPTYLHSLTDTICKDSIYEWNTTDFAAGKVYENGHRVSAITTSTAGTFTYIDSLQTIHGCDSIEVLYLYVPESYAFYERHTMSDEEIWTWQGRTYMGEKYEGDTVGTNARVLVDAFTYDTARYQAYYDESHYCDSIYYLTLRVGKVSRDTTYAFVCDNCTYHWVRTDADGTIHDEGTFGPVAAGETFFAYDSLKTDLDYDSIFVLNLLGMPTYPFAMQDTVCQNEPYIWQEHEQRMLWDVVRGQRVETIATDVPGWFTFVDSLKTQTYFHNPRTHEDVQTLCDSIWTLTLYIPQVYYFPSSTTICDNDTVSWEKHLFVGEHYDGEAIDPSLYDVVEVVGAGVHSYDTLYYSQFGCDSLYHFDLTVSATNRTYLKEVVSDRQPTWSFCHLTPANCHYGTEFMLADELLYDTTNVREPYEKVFIDTVPNQFGCDSILFDTVLVCPAYVIHEYDETCSNNEYDWRGKRGLNYRATDVYYDSLRSQYGTDSIFVLHLTVLPSVYELQDVDLCKNDTIRNWHNSVDIFYREEHEGKRVSFVARYKTGTGCDSIIEMRVNFYNNYHFYDTITICEGSDTLWRNQRVSEPGIYWDSLVTTASCHCDSVYQLVLYNSPAYYYSQDTAVCRDTINPYFTWVNEFGDEVRTDIRIDTAGSYQYIDEHRTIYGCDSNFILNIYVAPIYHIDSLRTMCDNDTLTWQGVLYVGEEFEAFGGTYNAREYDQVVILKADTTLTDTMYYQTTVYGCDSLQTMSLHVYPTPYVAISEHACTGDSIYAFNAKTLDVRRTGTYIYFDTLSTIFGCDSVIELTLTVDTSYYFYDTTFVYCTTETHAWHNRTYTTDSAKVIYDTIPLTTQKGCDSIYYMRATFHQAYFFDEVDTICGIELEYTYHRHGQAVDYTVSLDSLPNGIKIAKDYLFWDSCVSVHGCDSIYKMRLNVRPTDYDTIYKTICEGDTFYVHGKPLEVPGTYIDTIANQWGCDLITTVFLQVVKPTTFHLGDPNICADARSYSIPFTYDPASMPPLRFSLYYSDYAKQVLGFEDVIDRDIADGETELVIELPLLPDSTKYPRPGEYMAQLYFDNGICLDSNLLAVTMPFQVKYPKWVIEQHWNDFIGVLTSTYNGGYDFTEFQWYKNGAEIIGATNPYLFEPHWLNGVSYSAKLTRAGEMVGYMTCELEVDTTRNDHLVPTLPYISVVPTLVVKENPVVNILATNDGYYSITNAVGTTVASGRFIPDSHDAFEVQLPSVAGTYIFKMVDDIGLQREVKVIVQ